MVSISFQRPRSASYRMGAASWLLATLLALCVVDATELSSSSSNGVRQRSNRPKQRSRSLLCLGILRDCEEEEEEDDGSGLVDDNNNNNNNSTNDDVGGGAGSRDFNNGGFCLGIFRECDNNSTVSNANCSEATGGIFGGRPLFGECGIISQLLTGINGTDTDGDGEIDFEFGTNSSDKGPFGLGLLPEGGLLWRLFNTEDDLTFIESIMIEFDEGTNPFAFGFIEDWSESAVTSNKTCVNADTAPACFDSTGNDGFWVCRTLSDPYTGEPGSKTLCIGEGSFLEKNDVCGCCPAPNSNATTPVCPAQCPCTCDLDETGDGVWVTTNLNSLHIENATNLNVERCVDPRWAVSATGSFERINCLEKCPSE